MKFMKNTIKKALGISAAAVLTFSAACGAASAYSYEGDITFTPDKISESDDYNGIEFSDANIHFNANMTTDGKLGAIDGEAVYGGKTLMTVNSVFDIENGSVYFKIPELSDDYLVVSGSDILSDSDIDSSEIEGFGALGDISVSSVQEKLNALAGGLSTTLSAMGEGTPGTYKNTVSADTEYTFTSITYEITGEQLKGISDYIAENTSGDKELANVAAVLGCESFSELANEYLGIEYCDDSSKGILVLYFDGTDFAGLRSEFSEFDTEFLLKLSDGQTEYFNSSSFGDPETEGFYYTDEQILAVKNSDDSLSGHIASNSIYEDTATSNTLNFENAVYGDDVIKGTFSFGSSNLIGNENNTYKLDLTLDIDSTKAQASLDYTVDDKHYFNIKLDGAPSDEETSIVVPEKAYNALDEDEYEAYIQNADYEAFTANAKDVLGDQLYALLFGKSGDDSQPDDSNPSSEESNESTESTISTADSSSDSMTSSATTNSTKTTTSQSSNGSKSGDSLPDTGAALGTIAAVIAVTGACLVVVRKKD